MKKDECSWCHDTGLVDKRGDIAPANGYPLKPCPSCKKDGTAKLAQEQADSAIKEVNRKKSCWVLLVNSQVPERFPKEFEEYVSAAYPPKNGEVAVRYLGKTATKEYKVAFNPKLFYSTVKKFADAIEPGMYRIVHEVDANVEFKK